jgi:hypothetical protein
MSDRLTLVNAIEATGIPRDKAERAASVIFDAIHDNVATRADVQATTIALKADVAGVAADVRTVRTDIARVRSDALLIERRLLMRLGALIVVAVGVMFTALRLHWPPG